MRPPVVHVPGMCQGVSLHCLISAPRPLSKAHFQSLDAHGQGKGDAGSISLQWFGRTRKRQSFWGSYQYSKGLRAIERWKGGLWVSELGSAPLQTETGDQDAVPCIHNPRTSQSGLSRLRILECSWPSFSLGGLCDSWLECHELPDLGFYSGIV